MIGAQPFYPRNYARRVWQRNPERTFRELCLGPGAALAESQPLVLAEQQRVAVEQAFGPQSGDEVQMQMQMPGMAPRLA